MPRLTKNAARGAGFACSAPWSSRCCFRPSRSARWAGCASMLDLVASGEYEPGSRCRPEGRPADELSRHGLQGEPAGRAAARRAVRSLRPARQYRPAAATTWKTPSSSSTANARLVFASGSVEKFLGTDARRPAGPVRSPDIFPPNTTLGLLMAQAAQTGRPMRNRRVPLGTRRRRRPPSAWCCFRWTCWKPCPAARRPGSGMLVRLRDPEAQRKIGRRVADGRPPGGHQPHLGRRGARGEESAQRHPAARGGGARQAGSRRYRRSSRRWRSSRARSCGWTAW